MPITIDDGTNKLIFHHDMESHTTLMIITPYEPGTEKTDPEINHRLETKMLEEARKILGRLKRELNQCTQ